MPLAVSTPSGSADSGQGGTRLLRRGLTVHYLHLFVSFVSLMIVTPVMVNGLGPEGYGLWVAVASVMGYSTLLDFGMNTAIAKYTAEFNAVGQPQMVNRLASTALVLYGRVAVVLLAVSVGLAAVAPHAVSVDEELVWPLRVTVVLMGCNAVLSLVGGVFGNIVYGLQRVDLWKTCALAHVVASALLTVALLRLGFGLVGIAAASVCATVMLVAVYRYTLQTIGHPFERTAEGVPPELRSDIYRYGGRTVVLGLTSRILYSTDAIVIAIALGAASVGPYEIAYKICFLMTYLFSVISTTLFPRFSHLYALKDLEGARRLFLLVTWVSLAIVTPLILAVGYLGDAFISAWVGSDNFVGLPTLVVLLAMSLLHGIGTPVGLMLQATGKNKILTYSEVTNAVLNISLSLILVRYYGVLGVALGTLIAHAITSTWLMPLLACRYIELDVWQYLRQAVLPPIAVGPFVAVASLLILGKSPSVVSPVSIAACGLSIVTAYAVALFAFQWRSEPVQLLLRWVLLQQQRAIRTLSSSGNS